MLVNVTAACSALCYSVRFGMLYQYGVLRTPLFSFLHCLFPVSFCSVLKIEIQHTKCDRVISSCSDDLLSAND